ncbi:MAG: hypothetical protein ABSG53_08745 [Thermoguttaceae bacterium]|jgi:hypothetical protein
MLKLHGNSMTGVKVKAGTAPKGLHDAPNVVMEAARLTRKRHGDASQCSRLAGQKGSPLFPDTGRRAGPLRSSQIGWRFFLQIRKNDQAVRWKIVYF